MDLFGREEPRRPAAERAPIVLATILHQEPALGPLREAAQRGRLPHALLFWGPEGVGKTRAAQGLAQLLLCTAEARPCGACPACHRVHRFLHPDLLVLLPAARGEPEEELHKLLEAYGQDPYHTLRIPSKATIGIDRVRSLKTEASKARVERGNRVAIVRGADQMTPEAAQAALKLIEEPHPGTYLILTCRDPHSLLPTIVSRCQRYRFQPLPRTFVEEVLRARHGLAAGQARLVAALARGSLGRALEQAEEDVAGLRDAALALFHEPLRGASEATHRVRRLGQDWNSERAEALVDMMMIWYEDLLLLGQGLSEETVTNLDRLDALRAEAGRLSIREIRRRCEVLVELLESIDSNVGLPLATEAALIELHRGV